MRNRNKAAAAVSNTAAPRGLARCLLLLCWISLVSKIPMCFAAPPLCQPVFQEDRYPIEEDCSWAQQQKLPSRSVVVAAPRSSGNLPALDLTPGAKPGPPADYTLTLKRLVLRGMTLSPFSGEGGLPRLLPLGMFAAVPRSISIFDIRIVVSEPVFAECLSFFSQQLRTARDTTSGPSLHTDNSSVLNIPYWSDNTTEVFSLTVISGPCNIPSVSSLPWSASVKAFPSIPRCGIRIVDNTTLIPTLMRDAAVASPDTLLIRVVSNITLGPGILRSIPIRRPILLYGMVSAPTSVDLGMVVNQLNVTLPHGQITWQGLVLENLAPGDAVSSLVAPPFSTTVSSNVWAMFCNRSASSCLNLNNVTLVVPTQEELNYQVFMYTMFNSPAPALRDLTSFYRDDLNTSIIQFVPGPGNDTLTVIRLVNTGWDFWYVVSTLRPFVAPQRPMPRQALVMQKYRTGALVYALQDCGGFVSALSSRSTSSRMRVWSLINNVSIADDGHMQCSWPDGNVTYPTKLLGAVVHTYGPGARLHTQGAVASPLSPEAIVLGHADAASTSRSSAGAAPPARSAASSQFDAGSPDAAAFGEDFALSFGYKPSLFQLPVDAQDKFLHIQNVTLLQLPQMSPGRKLLRGFRRLLNVESSADVGIWTMLLWPVRRTMWGSPVTITDSQLVIPQPEWKALAAEAQQDASFAVQLQGLSGGLIFTDVSFWDSSTLRVGTFQGPGISGTNLLLYPDPEAALRPGYHWPADLLTASSSGAADSSSAGDTGMSAALRAGIGVAVSVLGLAVLALLAYMVHVRRQRVHAAAAGGPGKGPGHGGGVSPVADPSKAGHTGKGPELTGALVHASGTKADVGPVRDTHTAVAAGAALGGGPDGLGAGGGAAGERVMGEAGGELLVAGVGEDGCETPRNAEGCGGVGHGGEASKVQRSPSSSVEQTIANGLERWNAAVSHTTLQIMQRRLQSNSAFYSQKGGSGTGSSTAAGGGSNGSGRQQQGLRSPASQPQIAPPRAPAANGMPAGAAAGSSDKEQGLQLQSVIGTGSFGSVYVGSWRGKRVAIKVMHLHSNVLLDADHAVLVSKDLTAEQQEQRQRQRAQNSPPHMAIMEAVVSSTMSHPNVVQVYTYMLSPLMVQPSTEAGQSADACDLQQQHLQQHQQQGQPAGSGSQNGGVFGWQLRLVMEYCDQGTLREALDKCRLPRLPGTTFPHPAVVFSLCHDITAALLHLHSEGIVHGDLKAGNVLLTANPTPGSSSSCSDRFSNSLKVWKRADSPALSAKVADFGMSLPLGPTDTHATMLARGTYTHMSPELFMEGHVSKASDVYAFGILLYEVITGRRAYAGVPIPLLPHQVAMQGLRPEWPINLPRECQQLRELAELCWQHQPQDRPTFDRIMQFLERAGLPQQPADQQQQQDEGSGGQQVLPEVLADPDQASMTACSPGEHASRKPSKDIDWSEISYGGSRHNGGWS